MPRIYFSLIPKFPKVAGTIKEFRVWEENVKQQFPIRWKINSIIEKIVNKLFLFPSWKINDGKYWIYHRILPKYIYHKFTIKTLPPGYHDCAERILHVSFDLFTEFMEFQLSGKCSTVWDYTDEILNGQEVDPHVQERQEIWVTMNELYTWWTKDRPNREQTLTPLPKIPEEWGFMAMFDDDYRDTPEVQAWSQTVKEHNEIEATWHEEDEQMLIKLAKIRLSLWD